MFKNRVPQQPKHSARGRWQDDDDDIPHPTPQSFQSSQKPSFIKERPNPTQYQQQQFNRQPAPQRQPPVQFTLETQLLENILQPTGISIKPSENLMRDFCKRAKNLDREKIFHGIMEKVNPYKSYVGNPENIKMLTKCLYLIEFVVDNRVEDLYAAFDERQELFEDIKGTFSSNRKIVDLCAHIIKIFNPSSNVEGYNNMANSQPQHQQPQHNMNLLDIGDDTQPNSNANNAQGGGVDLLQDIFGGGNSTNNSQNNQNNNNLIFGNQQSNFTQQNNSNTGTGFDLFSQPNQPQMTQNQQPQEEKKGFSFVKKHPSQNPQSQIINDLQQSLGNQPAQKKGGFNFIKSKEAPHQNNNEILNDIFSAQQNQPQAQAQPQESMPTVDFTKMPKEQIKPPQPQFNYDLVYQNTESLKTKNANDPFNFVDDMIKAKK